MKKLLVLTLSMAVAMPVMKADSSVADTVVTLTSKAAELSGVVADKISTAAHKLDRDAWTGLVWLSEQIKANPTATVIIAGTTVTLAALLKKIHKDLGYKKRQFFKKHAKRIAAIGALVTAGGALCVANMQALSNLHEAYLDIALSGIPR